MIDQRLTLIQAQDLDPGGWDLIAPEDLDLDADTLNRLASVWLWLTATDPAGPSADGVRREVLTDGGLLVALPLPASELLNWFRVAGWEDFDSTERTGCEGWAWATLARIKAACDRLGVLAAQVPLSVRVLLD